MSFVCFRPNTVRRRSIREPAAIVPTEELLIGDEFGSVLLYCIEWPNPTQRDIFDWHGSMTLLARIQCHTQQVCGIAWSAAGEFFATGGNDNKLYLFDRSSLLRNAPDSTLSAGENNVSEIGRGEQKHVFTLNAAVKALAFAPWQASLLAAGGGSNDRCIHFFHARSGAALATLDCHAQVTALVWSARRKELAATFGFAQPEHAFRVAVFAWPSCRRILAVPWLGEERALYAVPYPGGPAHGPFSDFSSDPGSTATTTAATTTAASMPRPQQRGNEDIDHRLLRERRGHRGRGSGPGRGSGGNHELGRRRGGTQQPGLRDLALPPSLPLSGRRTREEGCLVIATSDASIKFHEIWADVPRERTIGVTDGVFGGSQILEDTCSPALERAAAIR